MVVNSESRKGTEMKTTCNCEFHTHATPCAGVATIPVQSVWGAFSLCRECFIAGHMAVAR